MCGFDRHARDWHAALALHAACANVDVWRWWRRRCCSCVAVVGTTTCAGETRSSDQQTTVRGGEPMVQPHADVVTGARPQAVSAVVVPHTGHRVCCIREHGTRQRQNVLQCQWRRLASGADARARSTMKMAGVAVRQREQCSAVVRARGRWRELAGRRQRWRALCLGRKVPNGAILHAERARRAPNTDRHILRHTWHKRHVLVVDRPAQRRGTRPAPGGRSAGAR